MPLSQRVIVDAVDKAPHAILTGDPGPIIESRLLRDAENLDARLLRRLRAEVLQTPQVRSLLAQQQPSGNWGGLHCGKASSVDKYVTTEHAVGRAVALGLDREHPAMRRCAHYLADLIQARREFPEREKNDRFPAGWRMFAAATLAEFDPSHKALDGPVATWQEILARAFADGTYSARREAQAHRHLHNVHSELRYLQFRNKYAVMILAARLHQLPSNLESEYARWLWKIQKIGYLDAPLSSAPSRTNPGAIHRWLASHELFALFPTGRKLASKIIHWLVSQRDETGLWDLGPRDPGAPQFRLSASWRTPRSRRQEWSLRIISLLRHYRDA